MTATEHAYRPHRGDVVEVDGRHVGDPGRLGEVVASEGEPGHERLRVRWEDGSESVLYGSEAHVRPRHVSE